MAYLGGIDYVDVLDGNIEWNPEVRLTQLDGVDDRYSGSRAFCPELVANACAYDRDATEKTYDQPDGEMRDGQKCVTVGWTKSGMAVPRAYYLLLVAPRTEGNIWERCGVGFTDRAEALDKDRVSWIRIT